MRRGTCGRRKRSLVRARCSTKPNALWRYGYSNRRSPTENLRRHTWSSQFNSRDNDAALCQSYTVHELSENNKAVIPRAQVARGICFFFSIIVKSRSLSTSRARQTAEGNKKARDSVRDDTHSIISAGIARRWRRVRGDRRFGRLRLWLLGGRGRGGRRRAGCGVCWGIRMRDRSRKDRAKKW